MKRLLLCVLLLGCETTPEPEPIKPAPEEKLGPPVWMLQKLLELGCTEKQIGDMLARELKAKQAGKEPLDIAFEELKK